ncbi:2Fe-2S iron-sulfur cluster binding domain-containing protein, partial [Candidatus Poribacteria bacterium]|nr:2Fe-2S iron-sulfur cluster binding domain-containing protein [Candidatus Poribacteria bacterium]
MKVRVARIDPLEDTIRKWDTYDIDLAGGETVLGALQYIYKHHDSTLAFQYGCRFKGCGLCTMKINGQARLACMTKAEDGMELSPLNHLPVLRDLAIDRRSMTKYLNLHRLHLVISRDRELPTVFAVPPSYEKLAACIECLACMSECPSFDLENGAFAGPLTFVKLAQLHFDPRDILDRKAQAKTLGISACIECKTKCRCPL